MPADMIETTIAYIKVDTLHSLKKICILSGDVIFNG